MPDDESNVQDNGQGQGDIGDTVIKGRVQDLEKLRHDGILTGLDKANQSVLRELISAVLKEEDYRQLLMKADFLTARESDDATNALSWARRLGVPIWPIMDKIAARCSVHARRVEQTIDAMTAIRLSQYWKGKGRNSDARGTTEGKSQYAG